MDSEKEQTEQPNQSFLTRNSYYVALFICALISASTTFLLYRYTQNLLTDRLHERLEGIASTAALQFDSNEIEFLAENGLNAFETDIYKQNVFKLQEIRNANKDIKYAYIFGKTDDPLTVKFVVDADAASLVPVIDYNHDELINDEDVSEPGEEYDASEELALQGQAFSETVISDISTDEWGQYLSVYSPIKSNSSQETTVTLALDVEVTDYLRIIKATFLPFLLFILLLLVLLTVLTLFIVRIWKSRAEVLTELDRQKDELLSIVSHQLATPVSSLKWYIEMMIDGDLGKITKTQMEHLRSMGGISNNLSDLVSMILDVSRIQLGRIKVEKQTLDLKELFNEILTIIAPKAEEKGVKFDVDIPKTFPKAQLDKRYTHMVIENLLSNAVKYTPKDGHVIFKVSIQANMISLSVKDTGCGIPLKDQAQIFGKLFRASNVRNSVEGNGFGLFVAKGAVEAQGGSIRFESKEGKGTTFYVNLPLTDSVTTKKKTK